MPTLTFHSPKPSLYHSIHEAFPTPILIPPWMKIHPRLAPRCPPRSRLTSALPVAVFRSPSSPWWLSAHSSASNSHPSCWFLRYLCTLCLSSHLSESVRCRWCIGRGPECRKSLREPARSAPRIRGTVPGGPGNPLCRWTNSGQTSPAVAAAPTPITAKNKHCYYYCTRLTASIPGQPG